MNDYYNDPPEVEEVPECCDAEMWVDKEGSCYCLNCGKMIEAQPEIEPDTDHFGRVKCDVCRQYYDPANAVSDLIDGKFVCCASDYTPEELAEKMEISVEQSYKDQGLEQ